MRKNSKTKKQDVTKSRRGAPTKPDGQKVLKTHIRKDQWQWAQVEGAARNMSAWAFIRMALDVARDVIDTKRGDVSTSALFDDVLSEPQKGEGT